MKNTLPPLCVDLDGTLVATDTLYESLMLLLRKNPLFLFWLPIWLFKGKAYLKHQIAQRVSLNVTLLPYHDSVVEFLQQQLAKDQKLILATAAHESIAMAVANHLKIFEEVIASNAQTNMKGVTKRDALLQRFGEYDYMGDSNADVPIFQAARHCFLVAPSRTLLKQIPCPPERLFTTPLRSFKVWLKALRVYQWVKNILVFVPLALSHHVLDITKIMEASLAFLTFSLVASAGYILNDLLDLAADRIHTKKKHRPFASGQLPIQHGLLLFILLIAGSFTISLWQLSGLFSGILAVYLLTTLSYSFYLKGKMVTDIIILAGLYTIRIIAGTIATSLETSAWLLAFSMFIFISLAFLKRYVELLQLTNRKSIKHRNYTVEDRELIASVGPTSGYLAVLVFSLYITSREVKMLYSAPFILWMICPLLLYWVTRMWFLARRGQMSDDPIEFALTDLASWFIIACSVSCILLAKYVSV